MKRFVPKWRFMTWVFVLFNVLMLIWVIAAGNSGVDCSAEVDPEACEAGAAIGKGIGIGFLLFLWGFGVLVLGLIWLMTRHRRRDCPVCGHGVKKGVLICPNCQHDFRSGVPQASV